MEAYLVSLTPDNGLRTKIVEDKLMIFEKFGNQKFLLDEPHSSIYIGLSKNIKEVETKLKEIILKQKIIEVEIAREWQEFKNDKLAGGGTTLGLKVIGENRKKIISLQKKIVNSLNELRNGEIHPRFKNVQLLDSFMESIERYGYPFVSSKKIEDILIPHISFCCFALQGDAEEFKKLNNLKKYVGPAIFPKISLYKINTDDSITLVSDFSLQQ